MKILNQNLQIAREGKWKVSIENVTDETGVLSIVGPNARELLADAVGDKDLIQNWKFLDAKKVQNNFSKIVFNI